MQIYDATPEQIAAEAVLCKQGFRFTNWISAQDEDNTHGCMVLQKRKGPRTEYREIAPDGSVN